MLTQHALALPGVVVPGLNAVLNLLWDVVGVHVLDAAVHASAVVVFPSCCSTDHVPHLMGHGECVQPHFQSTHLNITKTFSYLTNHDGERKDANKVIYKLEADLKDSGGIRQAANGD